MAVSSAARTTRRSIWSACTGTWSILSGSTFSRCSISSASRSYILSMAHDTPQAHAHAEHDHDKNAPKLYTAILAILIMLTFITVSASKIQFGSNMVNVVVALTIATIKASLVALFFMHLLH